MAGELPLKQVSIFGAQTMLFVFQIIFAGRVNSVALKALSYHTAVETVQTAARMMTASMRQKNPTTSFSYGYLRCSVLFEFSGIAVIGLMCASVAFEAVLRMNFSSVFGNIVLNSQEVAIPSGPKTNRIAVTSLFFSFLHGLMIIIVQRNLKMGERLHPNPVTSIPTNHPSYLCSWIFGIELRVHLSLVAIGFVVLCSWLVSWSGYGAFDSIGALACIALIVPILDGLTRKTAPILLQSAPAGPRAAFDRGCREVSTFEGVIECCNEHFWMNGIGNDVGSITVRVRSGVDTQEMLSKVKSRLNGAVSELTVQIEGVRPPNTF